MRSFRVGYLVALVIVGLVAVGLGVSAFYPEPKSPIKYPERAEDPQEPEAPNIPSSVYSSLPLNLPLPDDPEYREALRQYQPQLDAYDQAMKKYEDELGRTGKEYEAAVKKYDEENKEFEEKTLPSYQSSRDTVIYVLGLIFILAGIGTSMISTTMGASLILIGAVSIGHNLLSPTLLNSPFSSYDPYSLSVEENSKFDSLAAFRTQFLVVSIGWVLMLGLGLWRFRNTSSIKRDYSGPQIPHAPNNSG